MAQELAHVSYMLTEAEHVAQTGADFGFITSPLADPWNLAIFAAGAIFILALVYAGHHVPFLRDRVRHFRGRARSYQDFIGLILRLSLGVALIGAGNQNALLSPGVTDQPAFASLQIALGFLMIAGLALTPVTLGALALSIGALILHPELFFNLEIITGLFALMILGQSKPGLDDLLGLPMLAWPEKMKAWVPFLLRLGLGSSLVIMAITDKILNPHLFGFIIEHHGLIDLLPLSAGMWVLSAAITEIVLGACLLIGYQTRIVSAITLFVLSLSFFYFGEAVFAHVTIFGTLFVLMITGSGTMSLDDRYAKQRNRPA
jgi:uncharacterized membrane protein YphA (DoxX/SURF4 family)